MSCFNCSPCGTVAANGIRVSVGECDGKPAVEIVQDGLAARVIDLEKLAEKFTPEIPRAIKTGPKRKGTNG